MTSVLITGITGQDGGYLAERLLAEGCDVHGLVHDGDPHVGDLPVAELVQGGADRLPLRIEDPALERHVDPGLHRAASRRNK